MKKYTDQEFLYRQTPVNYDGIAKFTSIKGNTLAWNQLIQNGNFADTNSWDKYNCALSVSNNVATITATAKSGNIYTPTSLRFTPSNGDKILVCGKIKAGTDIARIRFNVGGTINVTENATTTWQTVANIVTAGSSGTGYAEMFAFNSGTAEYKDIMVFNLTKMGLDSITDPIKFTSLFNLPFYDYNQGTLIPFSGNGIKTVGFNQWDEEWELGTFNTTTGANLPVASQIRSKNFIDVLPNTPYFVQANPRIWCLFFDGNKQAIDSNAPSNYNKSGNSVQLGFDLLPLTTPPNARYMRFYCQASYGNSYKNDICINISDTERNGTYEPYTSITTDLPISTYFPTGMKRAGNVYDELTESKAITRVGSRAYQSGDENNANYVTDGTTTYYPLATETETDIDTEIFYPFYGGGTEQILPVNGSTPTTAPIFADIVYYTKIDTNTPYRKFWLVNGNGDRWNLTEKELKSFLDSPQGLGFQKSIDVTRYGERAYKNTETYNFPQVSGDVFFYDTVNATRYEKYNEFVRFLMVQPLTLYYQIPVSVYSGIADIYTLDCEVINLTKTESKTNRVLTSNIQINGLGFYQGDTVEINGTSATVTINNDGDFPVGFEIEISGDLKNPYFTLEQDGELYGEAKFNDDSNNFSSVYVDSKDGEQNVVLKQDGSILPNPLAYQDLSISNGSVYVTFVKLEKGVSTLTIGDDNDSVSGYTIRFTPMYRSI